jgi:hypothetical protein
VNTSDSIVVIYTYRSRADLHPHNRLIYKTVFGRDSCYNILVDFNVNLTLKQNDVWSIPKKLLLHHSDYNLYNWKVIRPHDSLELWGVFPLHRKDNYFESFNINTNEKIDSVGFSLFYDFIDDVESHKEFLIKFKDLGYVENQKQIDFKLKINKFDSLHLPIALDTISKSHNIYIDDTCNYIR